MDSWPEPVFSDSATAGVGGLITTASRLSSRHGRLRGRGSPSDDGNRIVSYGAVAGLSVRGDPACQCTALTYSYYLHEFSDRVMPVPGLPDDLDGGAFGRP